MGKEGKTIIKATSSIAVTLFCDLNIAKGWTTKNTISTIYTRCNFINITRYKFQFINYFGK